MSWTFRQVSGVCPIGARFGAGLWVAAALVLLVGLAGCDAASGYRDTGTRIAATTRFEPARMQGEWIVRERVASASDQLAAAPESLAFGAVDGDHIAVVWSHRACDKGTCTDLRTPLTANLTGPGRFVMSRGNGPDVEHWVLWTDADYRVAAIGTPSGAFGWIMTKGAVRSDLMQAAQEIMEWNGYDLANLVTVER